MTNLYQDFRFALRQLRKSPGFTLTAILTLALGIGAATAVFSLVDAVLLQPLPFDHPERIVALDTLTAPRDGSHGPATIPNETSYPDFFDWRAQAHSFDSLASWQGGSFTLGASAGNATARRVDGVIVSADFFRVLGVSPALGRSFTRAEESAGNRSVIIGHSLWQSALNHSPAAIGQTLQINEVPYTVVGVMPASFAFPNSPDAQLWFTPAKALEGKNPSGLQRGWNQIEVIGRLKPGVSIEQGRAEMQTIQRSLAVQYAADIGNETAVSVISETTDLTGDVEQPLHILFGAVCFLLLIACANVAGLLLTRSAGRRAELALRAALGASRLQITRQLLIESLTLSALGGLLGFALAAVALRVAPQFLPSDLPRLNELTLDPRVFFFALGASLVTGLLFGVAPAWRSSRLDPAMALRDNSRASTGGRSQNRLHSALVIGETALGLVLLVGAGLLIRSFDRVLSVDPGFNAQHLLVFKLAMPEKRFDAAKRLEFSQQLQAQFAALPGVKQATFAYPMPLIGNDMSITFTIPGRPVTPGYEPTARVSVVAANFFGAMQMPLRRGRFFSSAEDHPGSAPVMIVNQAFAERFFPGEDALGKRVASDLSSSDKPEAREIVGIVDNVVRDGLTEAAQPEYYIPFAQIPLIQPTFALRVAGEPAAYIETVRALVARDDASLPVYHVETNLLTRSTAQQKFQTMLLSGFAALALLLAAIGLYAVLSYMVAQRTVELGLRLALGAQRGDILTLVLRRGLVLSGLGLALGLGASALLTRYMATLLYKTGALDVLTFSAMTLVLLAVSTVACLVPAWRASRLDPNETLRQL